MIPKCSNKIIVFASFALAGCGDLNEITEDLNVQSVKMAVLEQIDTSLTVGEAFDGYKYFGETTWTSFEDARGREYVQVDCPIGLDTFLEMITSSSLSGSNFVSYDAIELKGDTVSVLNIMFENLDLRFSQQFIMSHDGSSFEVGASTFSIDGKGIRLFGGETLAVENKLDELKANNALTEIYGDKPISAIVDNEEMYLIIEGASKVSLEKLKSKLEELSSSNGGEANDKSSNTNDEDSSELAKAPKVLCRNHLYSIGVAVRFYGIDNQGMFPGKRNEMPKEGRWAELVSNGQTIGLVGKWPEYFKYLSKDLPEETNLLVCPSDTILPARQLTELSSENVSYIVGNCSSEFEENTVIAFCPNHFLFIKNDGDVVEMSPREFKEIVESRKYNNNENTVVEWKDNISDFFDE